MFSNAYNWRKSFSFWGIILLVLVNGWYGNNLKRWKDNKVIDQDAVNYYAYFPATFIYHDWTFQFTKNLPPDFEGRIWLLPTPDGKQVLKMTMGLSILWAPFETIAHWYAKMSHYKADGYSKPYSVAIFIAALFYLALGLFVLRKLLLKHFSEITTGIVLFLVVIGTNLMYYVISEPGMSHVYNFCLIILLIHFTIKWLEHPSWYFSVAFGLVVGLIILIRPVNIITLFIPLLWGVTSIKEIKKRFSWLLSNWKMLSLAVFVSLLVVLPQLVYWKVATGHWIYYSYQKEGFYFLNPHIIDGLFSYRKGWLLYTPIMAFALVGLVFLKKYVQGASLAIIVTLGVAIYVIYSWWSWWYGGSFGSRPMIDFYGLLAIPLAAFIQQVIRSKWIIKSVVILVLGFLVYLNQFQMSQYRTSLLHWDSMTKKAYWAIMFKKSWPPNYDKLIQSPDYKKALKGEDEY